MQFHDNKVRCLGVRRTRRFWHIDRELIGLTLSIAALAASAASQTTVTTAGTTSSGTVALFGPSSNTTVTNSPINVSGSSVGIGTASPHAQLDVEASGQGSVNLQLGDPSTTDHFFFLSNAPTGYASNLVQAGDQVIGYTGNGADSGNLDIIPWSTGSKGIRINASGDVGIGTTNPGASLEVNGNVKLTTGSGAAITFQDGTTQSTAYTGVICGGDYAESVDVTGNRTHYEPGDVLVIASVEKGDVAKSSAPYSTSVVGIYSTKPGTIGRRQTTPKGANEVPMAMIGIVPTKVTAENGPIHRGDLLVSSSTTGYAMKGTDRSRMLGAVIGKALGNLDLGTGVVEVVVTLQ